MKINIGIFAHKKQNKIGNIIADVKGQSPVHDPQNEIKVFVLVNGCTDGTVAIAPESARLFSAHIPSLVCDLPFSGKSRTRNFFVHETCEQNPREAAIFIDTDIRRREVDTLAMGMDAPRMALCQS